jgi:uncharacterized protein (TIGR03435 family)
MKILGSLVIVCIGVSAVFAQSFEVASIKPAAPVQGSRIMIGSRGGPGTADPGQMTFTNASIEDLIESAYNVKSYQITGPAWLESARFDVIARVPAGTTKEQSRIMMQNLLADRFKLVVHHSSKEASVYALVVAKGGLKLKESANETAAAPGTVPGGMTMMIAPGGKMRMAATGTTIAKFLDALGMQLDRPIIDATGLTGKYDITLDFAPDPAILQAKMAAMGVAPPPGLVQDSGTQDPNGAATIFSALPDQLGLRLEARKGPVDLLVVDSVQKTPTEN